MGSPEVVENGEKEEEENRREEKEKCVLLPLYDSPGSGPKCLSNTWYSVLQLLVTYIVT